MLGAGLGALALPACSSVGTTVTSPTDFAGARLSAILRKTFIPEIHDITALRAERWAADVNASIDIEFTDDWREIYSATARRRAGVDIAELFANDAHVFSDRLVEVTDLAEEIGDANGGWIEAARDAAAIRGRWYGIPWAYTGHTVNARKGLLTDIGAALPETYDDLLEVATRLRDEDLAPVAFSMGPDAPNDSAAFAYSLLWSFGGKEVDDTGRRVALDSEATRAALRYFRQLSSVSADYAFELTEAGNNDAFLSDDISMTMNASSIYFRARQDGSAVADDMLHLAPLSGPNGDHHLLELNTLAIFEHSRNRDAARDWIRFNTDPDHLVQRAQTSSLFFGPTLAGPLSDDAMPWHQDEQLIGHSRSAINGHMPGWPGPATLESGLVYRNGTVVEMFGAVGRGELSVDQAVSNATHSLRRVYET